MAENGTTIGTAYVQILPSTQGIASGIAGALTGGAVANAASGAGAALGGAMGAGMGKALAGVLPGLGIAGAAAGMVSLGKASVQTGMEFDAAMSQVYGLMASVNDGAGLTEAEMTRLRERAREMGSTTQFTAAQAADAMGYMALAGWDVERVYEGIPSVLALAQASTMDLGRASDIVTDYMGAFSKTAPTAEHLVDLLAYAQSNSNATTEQFAQAWQYSSGMMNAFGQSADTTTAILSRLADQGHKASTGGVELTAVMTALYQGMDKYGNINIAGQVVNLAEATENFNPEKYAQRVAALNEELAALKPGSMDYLKKISEFSEELGNAGNFRNMIDVLADIQAALNLKGYETGSVGFMTALSSLFTNVRGMRGIQGILNGDVKEMKAFETELQNSGGTAESVGKTMTDNLAGDLKILNSAIDDLKIAISDTLTPLLRGLVQTITPVFNWLSKIVAGKATPFAGMARDLEEAEEADWEGTGRRIQELIHIINTADPGSDASVAALAELNALRATIQNLDLSGEGENVVQGIGKGMTEYEFGTDAEQVSNGIIAAMDDALLAHSPARALIPTGENAAAGVALGMTGYDFTLEGLAVGRNITTSIAQGIAAGAYRIGNALDAAVSGSMLENAVLRSGAPLSRASAAGPQAGDQTSAITAAMERAFEGVSVLMDGNRVGMMTARTVSREIEREARAGRFAIA